MSDPRGTLENVTIPRWLEGSDAIVHVHHRDASAGALGDWPVWLPECCAHAIKTCGITRPWLHQQQLAELAYAGQHVAICTPTASGKTLGYLMPVMAATAAGPDCCLGVEVSDLRTRLGVGGHTALYLAPTKALAHDQWRAARELGPAGWDVCCLDGDSEAAERRFARDHASYILTNPDMLHRSVLPNHARWSRLLSTLRYVVIDESHRYRGVFGAQMAVVVRRLRRLCERYGSRPVFLLASATASNAGEAGAKLIGEPAPLAVVAEDTSAHPARDMVLWAPQDTAPHDAAELMAQLVDDGKQVITFVASRTQAELIGVRAQDRVTSGRSVASYRSGYLADERRKLEAALHKGTLSGVAATNALELGIDVSGMDAVILTGFPGTLAALWQQAGRAGRGDRDALVVLMKREDPLDSFLFKHPELIFDAPVEETVLFPDNPYVLGPQLAAAAQEAPLTSADERWFGPSMPGLLEQLTSAGLLRKRPNGWFWTRPDRAVDAIDLRSLGGKAIDIVDLGSGRVVGVVDRGAADRTVHPGAVYLQQGDQWLVDEYLPDDNHALVHLDHPGYFTQPKSVSQVRVLGTTASRGFGRGTVSWGNIELTSQVIGYLRRDEITTDVWDETPLALPEHRMQTKAMWWTVPDDLVAELEFTAVRLGAAAHAMEHTMIGLLPMFAPCDRWDIGGVSTVSHPDTGVCTVFVHDGHPGGSGFAERGYQTADSWARATLERLNSCRCETGCPACVVSPKCGNGNTMLDKGSAAQLLAALLAVEARCPQPAPKADSRALDPSLLTWPRPPGPPLPAQ